MALFRRKSRWEQASEPVIRAFSGVADRLPGVAKSALKGVGVAVGLSAASAAVTVARERSAR
jgi:hypothetical protein